METVQNVVNAASQAIFGKPAEPNTTESTERTATNETKGTEPLSGVQGSGKADEPYDQGNAASGVTAGTNDAAPATTSSATTTLPIHTKTSGTADSTGANVDTSAITPAANTTSTAHTYQGADRPHEEPSPRAVEAIKSSTTAAENTQSDQPITDENRLALAEQGKLPHDPNDHSGEPMKMHDGSSSSAPTDRSKSVAQEGGDELGAEKGTGEQWVKSTGVAAEGGDFDATKSGAGKEATRLLEEQGVHRDTTTTSTAPTAATTSDETSTSKTDARESSPPGKVSKLDKLKDKLHIGHGSKHL